MTQRSQRAPRWAVRDEGQREGSGLCFCGWGSGLRPPSVLFYFIYYDFLPALVSACLRGGDAFVCLFVRRCWVAAAVGMSFM